MLIPIVFSLTPKTLQFIYSALSKSEGNQGGFRLVWQEWKLASNVIKEAQWTPRARARDLGSRFHSLTNSLCKAASTAVYKFDPQFLLLPPDFHLATSIQIFKTNRSEVFSGPFSLWFLVFSERFGTMVSRESSLNYFFLSPPLLLFFTSSCSFTRESHSFPRLLLRKLRKLKSPSRTRFFW